MQFLKELTAAVVESSRVYPGQRVGESPVNTTGGTLIRPGGRECYPAYWIRDFAMSLESGCITEAEMLHHLRVVARSQNDDRERVLDHAIIPAFSVPDHVNFDGGAVFFPGTMSAGR